MNRAVHPRTMSKLSASTCGLLESYTLAATAAGVGALAFARPSEAKIVYTPTHHLIKTGTSYNLDLNRDRVIDFTLRDTASSDSDSAWWSLSARPAQGNSARVSLGLRSQSGRSDWRQAVLPREGNGIRRCNRGRKYLRERKLGERQAAIPWLEVSHWQGGSLRLGPTQRISQGWQHRRDPHRLCLRDHPEQAYLCRQDEGRRRWKRRTCHAGQISVRKKIGNGWQDVADSASRL
jgi:hypothetical protein